MKTLVLLLTVLATASAMDNLFWMGDYLDDKGELGKGCCLPTQWEGRVGAFHIRRKFLFPKVRASDSKVGLDFPGKKVAARSMFYCKKTKRIYETRTVADYNAKKVYFIYKDKCKTFNLKRSMRRPCIPDSFRQYAPYTYGAGSDSLSLTAYGYRNASRSLTTEVFSVVTRGSCVPVKGAYRVKRRFRSMMGNYQYYNITAGIRDRDLYKVPSFCNRNSSSTVESSTGSRKNLWRKFKNYVGYSDKVQDFSSESELTNLVEGDLLSQMMELIDGSMEQAKGGAERGHSHWRGRHHRYRRHHRDRDYQDHHDERHYRDNGDWHRSRRHRSGRGRGHHGSEH